MPKYTPYEIGDVKSPEVLAEYFAAVVKRAVEIMPRNHDVMGTLRKALAEDELAYGEFVAQVADWPE